MVVRYRAATKLQQIRDTAQKARSFDEMSTIKGSSFAYQKRDP